MNNSTFWSEHNQTVINLTNGALVNFEGNMKLDHALKMCIHKGLTWAVARGGLRMMKRREEGEEEKRGASFD